MHIYAGVVMGRQSPTQPPAQQRHENETGAQVIDLFKQAGHAAFLGRLNKARCDKGLRAPGHGYQQCYPQKFWTSPEYPAKSSTCGPMCKKDRVQRHLPSICCGHIRLLTAQLCTCLAQRCLARAKRRQLPGHALGHDKDH